MLHPWTQILPHFVVRWLALKLCERLNHPQFGEVVCPFYGTIFVTPIARNRDWGH